MTPDIAPRRLDRAQYSTSQSNALRLISISSCSASLLAAFIMYYTYLAIHPTRRKFRHQLIFFLVTFDFLKAIAMIVFPILTYLNPDEVGQKTINFLGFFTALSIEGGDLAILSFAVHTLLTIFYPQRTGGLYFIRYYVYALSAFLPALLASLAFINDVGYKALDVFCYLPESPRWYRLVLSWGPRYFIMAAILIIYCTIYFYVINQLKRMEKDHLRHHRKTTKQHKWSLSRWMVVPKKEDVEQRTHERGSSSHGAQRTDTTINLELQMENSQRLKTRYKVIARQMKIVFLYPIAYFLLWIFPLVQNSLQLEGYQNFGMSVLVAFIQPFNGVIDTIVWLYREKPWLLTYMNTPTSPFTQDQPISKWRYRVQWLPLFALPEPHNDTTVIGSMEVKNITNNLMLSINPEEFVHTPTSLSSLDPDQTGVTSTLSMSCKRNPSASSSDDEDEVEDGEMDFLDFLNKGPPM